MIGVLHRHGIPAISDDRKAAGRALALRGVPFTNAERAALLDYCKTDVDALAPLLERMLPLIRRTNNGLGQALLRGRYSAAQANDPG